MPMSPKEFAEAMRQIDQDCDVEIGHSRADDLMCAILRELGYEEGVNVFDEMVKWYA